jgi:adenosylhomocysteine nucleosidase
VTDRFAAAFVCAMPMELEPLRPLLALTEEPVAEVTLHRGSLDGRPVVAIVTGMGPALATAGLSGLLDAVAVERVVVVGITGALEQETPIGTIVRPMTVIDGATGTEYAPAPLGSSVPSAGSMWTTDRLITDPAEVAALRDRGVVALDMETAAIAAVCTARGVPWSVVRAISDRAGDGSIDDDVFALSNADGTPDDEAVERYFAEHPEKTEAMAKLAEGALLATRVAAEAAVEGCRRYRGGC